MMKKHMIFLIFLTCIFISCQSNLHKSSHPITKAIIYYNANKAPWGILRIATVETNDYLRDSTNLAKIIIRNRDTLQFISDRIMHANAIASKLNIDTWIVALLYSGSSGKIDTLSIDAYPQNDLQYNRIIFRDSVLAYYLIDLIRSHSPVWNERAKNFYYDGKYNPLPKSFWNTGLDER